MNLSSSDPMLYHTLTQIDENKYLVCYDTPPRTVSDGLWAGQETGRSPMKSFMPILEMQFLLIFAINQIFRLLLKPLGFPLYISQMLTGLVLNVALRIEPLDAYAKMLFPLGSHDVISTISSIGYVFFVFINGVQMDFSMITRTGKKAWTIAIIGIGVPFITAFATLGIFFAQVEKAVDKMDDIYVALVSNSIVAFPVIASLLNELEITNSELGRLALSSALVGDVCCKTITTFCNCMVETKDLTVIAKNLFILYFISVLIPLVFRPAMFWIIKHTPEGRPVKSNFISIIIALVFILGYLAVMINQEFILGAFILGLSVPEGPPLGSALVKKLNFFGTSFLLPIFMTTVMLKADLSIVYSSSFVATIGLSILFVHLIKLTVCFLLGLYCGIPKSDALCLALILNHKGVVEICVYYELYDNKVLDRQGFALLIFIVMIISTFVQLAVKFLYDPSRKYAGYQKRNLMSLRPNSELRVLVTIHKKNHISPMLDVLDLFSPTIEKPIIVDALHLIELVGRALPIFVPHHLQRQQSGSRKSYSDDIILAFDIYEHENIDAASVFTFTSISPPGLMHEDVCGLALDKVASIIILPFHQRWSTDGLVESEDKNLRNLNCKVLEIAPCSVGILVNRPSRPITDSCIQLALIYLGGNDDQEALCLAKRAINNPRIKLVIYHLVVRELCAADLDELMNDEEEDMIMLEEIVKYAHNVTYHEVIANDGSQTASFLCDIVNEHDFFIVGRGHDENLPQINGLTNWSEFPELGVIGDFIASPDFKSHASILVVQQQLSPNTHTHRWIFN